MARIKICGITNKEDAHRAHRLGAWALGFIFYRKSPRYIDPNTAKRIIASLPRSVLPVGVFVNESLKNIQAIVAQCGLRVVQLHGNETPAFCSKIKKVITIKAICVKHKQDVARALRYKTSFLLFDTYLKGVHGGTGKVFDWDILQESALKKQKIILSGGLNPENIVEAVKLKNIYAYDVSSGVERRPGKKCLRLMRKFLKKQKGEAQ